MVAYDSVGLDDSGGPFQSYVSMGSRGNLVLQHIEQVIITSVYRESQ